MLNTLFSEDHYFKKNDCSTYQHIICLLLRIHESRIIKSAFKVILTLTLKIFLFCFISDDWKGLKFGFNVITNTKTWILWSPYWRFFHGSGSKSWSVDKCNKTLLWIISWDTRRGWRNLPPSPPQPILDQNRPTKIGLCRYDLSSIRFDAPPN